MPPKPEDKFLYKETGREFVSLGTVVEYLDKVEPTTIIATSYEDANENGAIEIDEFIMNNDLSLKENKKFVLGMYLPKTEKAKKGTIELYSGREKVLESEFEIDTNMKIVEVDLERIVRDSGIGCYTAAFYVNDKCWEVRPIGVGI